MSQLHTELLGKGKKLRKDRVESRGPSKAALSDDQMPESSQRRVINLSSRTVISETSNRPHLKLGWIDDCLPLECIASVDDNRVR